MCLREPPTQPSATTWPRLQRNLQKLPTQKQLQGGFKSLRGQPTQILRGCMRFTILPTWLLKKFPFYKSFHLKKKRCSLGSCEDYWSWTHFGGLMLFLICKNVRRFPAGRAISLVSKRGNPLNHSPTSQDRLGCSRAMVISYSMPSRWDHLDIPWNHYVMIPGTSQLFNKNDSILWFQKTKNPWTHPTPQNHFRRHGLCHFLPLFGPSGGLTPDRENFQLQVALPRKCLANHEKAGASLGHNLLWFKLCLSMHKRRIEKEAGPQKWNGHLTR